MRVGQSSAVLALSTIFLLVACSDTDSTTQSGKKQADASVAAEQDGGGSEQDTAVVQDVGGGQQAEDTASVDVGSGGNAAWDAGNAAGKIVDGVFVSASRNPWYDSYKDYAEKLRLVLGHERRQREAEQKRHAEASEI